MTGTNLLTWFPQQVIGNIESMDSCIVSFSGGVDSSVVLAVASQIMGASNVHAVTFASWLHPVREIDRTKKLAGSIGVKHIILPGPELGITQVVNNYPERCALCKEARIEKLLLYAETHAIRHVLEGTNADDIKDPTRLGTKILGRHGHVYSPLAAAGLSKERTRLLAKALGIEWWDEAASACMATRFPLYGKLEEKELRKVAKMEQTIKEKNFSQVRVRVFGETACIEVKKEDLGRAVEVSDFLVTLMHENGFSRVALNLEGYSSGRKWISIR